MPLIATIAAATQRARGRAKRIVARRARAPLGVDAARSRGPHAGQALGWAWKRRSRGVVVLALARRAHGERRHRGRGRS